MTETRALNDEAEMCVCWYEIRHPASPAMNDEMPKATNFVRAMFTPIDVAARSFVRTDRSRRPVALRRRFETASATSGQHDEDEHAEDRLADRPALGEGQERAEEVR